MPRKKKKLRKKRHKRSSIINKRYLYLAEFPDNSIYLGKSHLILGKLYEVFNKTTNSYSDKTGLKPIFTILTPLKKNFILENIKKHLIQVFKDNNYKVLNTERIRN